MSDHERDLALLRDATHRLLSAASELTATDTAAASLLPGWTRGHVLTHLARNADALVNVLEGRPMYVSAEAREADITAGATRAPGELLADVTDSADRFLAACAAVDDWSRKVELRGGVTDTAAGLPFRRTTEVELHHVDLGIGYALEDLPADFVSRESAVLAARFHGNESVPAVLIEQPGGPALTTGRRGEHPVVVSGSPADVLGWLSGRRAPAGLKATGGAVPHLPSL